MSKSSSLPIQAPRQQLFSILKSTGFYKYPCRDDDSDLQDLNFDWVWRPPGLQSDALELAVNITTIDGEPLYGTLRVMADLVALDMVKQVVYAHFHAEEDLNKRNWEVAGALVFNFSETDLDQESSINLTFPAFLKLLVSLTARISSVEFWYQVKVFQDLIHVRRQVAHCVFVSQECTPLKVETKK